MHTSIQAFALAASLLPSVAGATEWSGSAGVAELVDRGDREEIGGFAATGGLGYRLTPQILADGQLLFGLSRDATLVLLVSPGVRAFVSEPYVKPLTLSGHLGFGPMLTGPGTVAPDNQTTQVLGSLRAGVDADVHLQHNLFLRAGLSYHTAGTTPAAGALGLAVVFAPKPEPEPEPEPVEKPAPVTVEADPTQWVPHPVCEWVPEPDAKIFFENYPGRWAPPPGQAGATPPPGVATLPDQGSILIAAWPGDTVWVDGQPVSLASDDVAIIASPSGFHPVEVSGSGRHYTNEVLVEQGFGVWVVPPRPAPIEVRFPVGSAQLTAEERELLAAVAEHRGVARLVVDGSYSAEGDLATNQRLARQRADAVVAALVEAGVPAEAIEATTSPPDPSRTTEEQRRVRIRAEVAQ